MVLNFIDIPNLYRNTVEGEKFIYALNDCEDLKIFSLRSVQIIIDCHYRHWKWLNLKALGLPQLILLFFFWHWSNIILTHLKKDADNEDNDNIELQATVDEIIIIVISFYLIAIGMPQLKNRPLQYFSQFEKLYGIINLILIIYNAVNRDVESITFWTIQMWIGLFVWIRFALYLRSLT